MSSPTAAPGPEDQQIQDRELNELTNELRVIIPGVTVLFAFLLTVPFSAGFAQLREPDRVVYMVSLLSAAASLVLLLGESAYHRLRGKPYDKELLIHTGAHQAVGGLILLLVSLTSSVWYVTRVVFPATLALAVGAAGGLLALALGTWLLLPLLRRWTSR